MAFDMARTVEILQRTPGVLGAMLGGISDFWTLRNYGEATFSPFDVVGHLLEAEQFNWMVRVRLILQHGEAKPFPPFDRYAMYESSTGKSLSHLLESFATLRARNLDDLVALNLTPAMLDARGTHPDLGPVTLSELLATWVVHDLGHVHQIAKAMAFQYRDAVGPWINYLSILPRNP